jgi:hypothetical protein
MYGSLRLFGDFALFFSLKGRGTLYLYIILAILRFQEDYDCELISGLFLVVDKLFFFCFRVFETDMILCLFCILGF